MTILAKTSSTCAPMARGTLALALATALLTACGGGGSTTVSTTGGTATTGGTTTTGGTATTGGTTTTGGTATTGGTTAAAKTFTKMTASGGPVRVGFDPVACVQDNQTKKYWEVKSDEPAGQTNRGETFRDKDYGYFWYDGTNGAPGPSAGTAATAKLTDNLIPCQASAPALTSCNTKAYIDAVNAVKLCGKTNWRLPTKDELLSLVDKSQTKPPYIYPDLGSTNADAYVRDQATRGYWSSTVAATDPLKRSVVSFGAKNGVVEDHFMQNQIYNYVRLIAD
ncbi:MAG: DUF1566 domain-containing protein [Thiothrix sp.]